MTRASSLTALVGSRICHDLVSPLGAIGNGVELMGLSGVGDSPEFALIEESVRNANARLKFFRIAFGAAQKGQMLSKAEIVGTLTSIASGGRVSYFWEIEGDQPKELVRTTFLLFQCMETAMPYGGDIAVRQVGASWEIKAEAERLQIKDDLWEALQNPRVRASVSPAEVQFALLPEVLTESGRTLALKISETEILAKI